MKIYYDSHACQWYQSSLDTVITLGGTIQPIPILENPDPNLFTISLNEENNHAGPLIGIMTARRNDGTITGNNSLFIKLQKKIIAHGGLSFIFTPDSVHGKNITGYTFLPDKDGWKKMKFPYPDLVYNRIPFRKEEQTETCQRFLSILKEKGIPFFNPCFLDKYELYRLFQKHPVLTSFFPKTELAADKQLLSSFLKKHPCVYLKPSHSAKGKGIFRLAIGQSKELILEGLQKKQTFSSFHTFWAKWKKELINKQYLVQEEIDSSQYEGKKFDLRILAHAENKSYSVTGVGIRQSQTQNLTTHIPNGGRLLPYAIFQTEECDQFIKLAVCEIGKTLSQHYGYFGEFSIDAGISTSGEYYIYEVNSKPMSFDETEIEEKRIMQLCRLFFERTKFPFTHENPSNAVN